MNCYLPSGNSPEATEKFKEDLDALHIIIQKYGGNHDLLLIGDFNMDHYHRKGHKENAFTNLVKENHLRDLGGRTRDQNTYVNPHLNHKSRIDHAFCKSETGSSIFGEIRVSSNDEENINTSYHCPIVTTITFDDRVTSSASSGSTSSSRKRVYPRNKLNKELFTRRLSENLGQQDWDTLNSEVATQRLIEVINSSVQSSTKPLVIRNIDKRNKTEWYPELEKAVKNSKEKHYLWKQAGKPSSDDPTWIEKKEAKRMVRSVQRRKQAQDRMALLEEISQATENDPNLAHKLIRRQTSEDGNASCLKINDKIITNNEEITSEWATYFENLTKSETQPEDELELQIMRHIGGSAEGKIFSMKTLDQAINTMKTNKAADDNGHYAELLKLFPLPARRVLLSICNRVLEEGTIPATLKRSYKIVLPKPGKNKQIMDNYRGITIAGLLLKLLETLWAMTENESTIGSQISSLQFGFTRNRSPGMASLLVTESIANAKADKTPLYVISLDARKAFDVVDHFLLKKKLFHSGISHGMWKLVDDMYVGSEEKIKWQNSMSRLYQVQRGVKQGSVISPLLYKLYINDLLQSLQKSNLGQKIGSIYVGAPACADDVLLITNNRLQIQPLLDSAHKYSLAHKYQLHPQKSSVTQLLKVSTNNSDHHNSTWQIGNDPVSITEEFTHLGLTWKSGKTHPDVSENIKKARRTSYSLLRIGLHGLNGIDPPAALKIIQTYVTPRLIHGLEACVLPSGSLRALDQYYKNLLRQIQGLPENTATEAVFLLCGAVPIEAQLHRKTLSLFGQITRLPREHQLYNLAKRQFATQLGNPNSWFTHVYNIGRKYNIDIIAALDRPEDKITWKRRCRVAVNSITISQLIYDTARKGSLKWGIWMWPCPSSKKTAHPLWTSCEGKAHRIEMATTRARMIIGRFKTQDVVSLYKGNSHPKTCQLCNEEDEDIKHMVVSCKELKQARLDILEILQNLYHADNTPPARQRRGGLLRRSKWMGLQKTQAQHRLFTFKHPAPNRQQQ